MGTRYTFCLSLRLIYEKKVYLCNEFRALNFIFHINPFEVHVILLHTEA